MFDYMATELVKIERTSLTLINALKSLKAGRPSNFFCDAALALMCQALQEAVVVERFRLLRNVGKFDK